MFAADLAAPYRPPVRASGGRRWAFAV